jgi:hypothetical protein
VAPAFGSLSSTSNNAPAGKSTGASGGLFGGLSQPKATEGTSLFGASKNTQAGNSTGTGPGLFGPGPSQAWIDSPAGQSKANQNTSVFGTTKTMQAGASTSTSTSFGGSLFGRDTSGTTSIFGKQPPAAASKPANPFGGFGSAPPPQPAAASKPANPFGGFGSPSGFASKKDNNDARGA